MTNTLNTLKSTPSIVSAVNKLRVLLTKEEKIQCLWIAGFALFISFFELVTASVIVIFAQTLNYPEIGQKYLIKMGFSNNLSPSRAVLYIAIMVGIIYTFKNIVAALEVFHQNSSIQKMNYNFKKKLLQHYSQLDYGFYLTRNSSVGMQVVDSAAELVFSTGMVAIANILSEGIIFLCFVVMIIYMNPSLALIIFTIGAALGICITKFLLPRFYQFGEKAQESSIFSTQHLIQFFHAFKEIVLLGKRDAFITAYHFYSQKKSQIRGIQTTISALPRMLIEIMFIGLFVVSIAYLCLEHETPAQMIGILSIYLYTGFRLMPGLNRMISQLSLFKATIPFIDSVYKEYTSSSIKGNYIDLSEFQFEKKISFKNVYFRYLNTEKDALIDINFDIKKGESIGIVGETGSGKSTLVDIILGLLRPNNGSVLIDDKYPLNSQQWHQKIGYVPQSIYLTDDTIGANIAFGEHVIDETRLNAAIDAAQLRQFINNLPQGYKTIVGERGIRLSGGERQRITIARVLYHNPEVLIFDEATSALDNETETRLMDTINFISRDRTVIMVAHRLSTLKDCKRIIAMEMGRIKDITTYASLSKNSSFMHAHNS